MDEQNLVPVISKAHLSALDRLFPPRSADLSWTDRQVWFEAGKRALVEFLHAQHEAYFTDVSTEGS